MPIFPNPIICNSISEELTPFLKYCNGIVLNTGFGVADLHLGKKTISIDVDPGNEPNVVADLHQIPLMDESVDTVVSIEVLEHTRYAWIVAQEFFRVLKPGGFGIIAISFMQPQQNYPNDYIRFTRNGLVELMEFVGFDIVETKQVNHFGQTLALLLWEYLQYNTPKKYSWFFWSFLINQLSKGNILGKNSPNTSNKEYVVVTKSGEFPFEHSYYLEAFNSCDIEKWFYPLLQCPKTKSSLVFKQNQLVSTNGESVYDIQNGKPHIFTQKGEFKTRSNLIKEHSNNFAQETNTDNDGKILDIIFKSKVKSIFYHSKPKKIAVLPTLEYEGIFKNGGVGTYYKNLARSLAAKGWYVIVYLPNTEEKYAGKSDFLEVSNVFSNQDLQDILVLDKIHISLLEECRQKDWWNYLSISSLFFVQALTKYFQDSKIYVEFHELCGIGYQTMQAKRSGLLGDNCLVATTLHSGIEWIYEANEKYIHEDLDAFLKASCFEQYSFENADVSFFPSNYLQDKVGCYGWNTDGYIHLPNYIPLN
jgi:Methyltransferase domain